MFPLLHLSLKPTPSHIYCIYIKNFTTKKYRHKLTGKLIKAGGVKFPNVELKANDSKHENGEEEQQADLQQGDHGLHYGFEHYLQACRTKEQTDI